jgi:predicted secreted hydrolase
MSADFQISRRALLGGLALLGYGRPSLAQGFAELSRDASGFAAVTPGRVLSFPADHGPHPDFRIEWWYVTANLTDAAGRAHGMQWTLFRQAIAPGGEKDGWASQQIWMGHAAVTRADTHRFSESFARGGIGQAGVETNPLRAWIDAWEMRALDGWSESTVAPLTLAASGRDFSYALRLEADRPLVLEGDAGYSPKSERGDQASYYYSQPYFKAAGSITIDGRPVQVSGQAWMDREWSSQPLAPGQAGWDWFSLHLKSGDKLMLYRLRQADGQNFLSGNWIGPDGHSVQVTAADIETTPTATTRIGNRNLPTAWRIALPARGLKIETTALNANSWMGTSFSYWEGPISFTGSHDGVGYLELTGY